MSEISTGRAPAVRRRPKIGEHAVRVHVLIADMDPATRDAREQQLLAVGCRVSLARTAFEAIVKASCQMPDAILLDSALTDIEATQACELLATCPMTAHIPAVRLAPGRPVPQRVVSALRRRAG